MELRPMNRAERVRRLRNALIAKARAKGQLPTCVFCNQRLYFGITLEHLMPRARGGTDHWKNLALSCAVCNTEKGMRTVDEFNNRPRRDGACHVALMAMRCDIDEPHRLHEGTAPDGNRLRWY